MKLFRLKWSRNKLKIEEQLLELFCSLMDKEFMAKRLCVSSVGFKASKKEMEFSASLSLQHLTLCRWNTILKTQKIIEPNTKNKMLMPTEIKIVNPVGN